MARSSKRKSTPTKNYPKTKFPKDEAVKEFGALAKNWTDKDTEPTVAPVDIGDWGVQTDRWKLVEGEDGWRLYDSLADPEQKVDVSDIKSGTTNMLIKYLTYWQQNMVDDR